MSSGDYEKRSRAAAIAAISRGYVDAANLRDLLIWTTVTTTEPMVSEYFSQHLDDASLLSSLFRIALEGEDNGDAPWAAANVIARFPATLLARHKSELLILADERWDYLRRPARVALAKLAS